MEILKNNTYSYVRGFNYQPSYASHGIEIWGEKFDPIVIERELGLGKKYFPKMNTICLWLSFDAFVQNPDVFMEHVEHVLGIGDKYNLKFIIVIFNAWHSIPDLGGVSLGQIASISRNDCLFEKAYGKYIKRLVGQYAEDSRILLWDLCNEPFCPSLKDTNEIYMKWLTRIYETCKQFNPAALICVGSIPTMLSVQLLEPISDVLTPHPYYAWNMWIPNKEDYVKMLDEFVVFANKKGKALLGTETCWGSWDDKHRGEIVRFELSEQTKRRIGFTAHLLHETYVSDGHRENYGLVIEEEDFGAGYMAFINMDGALRPHHGVFNEFC